MTGHFERIYRERARDYDRMVAAEDCDGNLLPAIEAVRPLAGADVVEVGVGTGRITRLVVAAGAASIVGFDASAEMLAIAREHLQAGPSGCSWRLAAADVESLPVETGAADVAIAGWVLGHATEWFAGDWTEHVDRAVAELCRVTRAGGAVMILETLGTGVRAPAPPTPGLAAYYERLEAVHGFAREALATDYAFSSPEDAARACAFFFGHELAHTIRQNRWARVPEWTGLWWRQGR